MASSNRTKVAVGVFILVVGLGIRLFDLGKAPLWGDEIFSWMTAHLRPSHLISYLYQGNNPPLWELILSAWLKWRPAGDPANLRFLQAVFSALTAVVLLGLGWRWSSLAAGLTSALLWIFSTYGQSICREARAYGLLSLMSAICLYAFWGYYHSRKGFWTWAVSSILILHVHYTGVFLLGAEVVWLLIRWRTAAFPVIGRYGLTLLLGTGLGFVVWFDRMLSYKATGYGPRFSHESLYNLLWAFSNEPVPTVIALSLIGLTAIYLYRSRTHATRAQNAKETLLFFLLLVGLLVIIGFRQPLWQARYFVPLSISYLWVLGSAVAVWPSRLRLFGMLILVGSWVASFRLRPAPMSPEMVQIGRLAMQKPQNRVLLISPDYMAPVLAYFLREDTTLLCKDCADITSYAMYKLGTHYRIYGASHYASLPVCEILAQDTVWWIDDHLCSAQPGSLLEVLLLEDFTPIAMERLARRSTFMTLIRREPNPSAE